MVCLGILILKSTENFRVILSEIIELWKRFFESALYFRWREKRQSLVPGLLRNYRSPSNLFKSMEGVNS